MALYHEQIKKIKANGPIEFIKINYDGKKITLKLVDDSDETVHLLTKWRKINRYMFGTNFEMSEERTKKWIQKNLRENPEWILFMIYVDGEKYGNMGSDLYDKKTNSAILDNIMKDPNQNYPGVMTVVEKTYLRWMFDGLKLSKITGDLFSDNYKMMNLHYKCGWTIVDAVPLKRVFENGGWRWEKKELKSESEYGERYFFHLEITKERLMEKFGEIKYEIMMQ